MEGSVYKIDSLPWCDSNHIQILESIQRTPTTKNTKFCKDLNKSGNRYRGKNQGDEPGKCIFTEFTITE